MNLNELALKESAEGVLLPVQAHAGARKNQLTGIHDGRLKVSVTQAPEQGKANRVIQELIADSLQLTRGQVVLKTGTTSPKKLFVLTCLTVQEVQRRLGEIFARPGQ